MDESGRDYVGYGGQPPRVEWPGGARLALNLAVNFEEGSELGAMEGDPRRELLAEATYAVRPEERELTNESIYQYGSRAGVWRIMRLLDKYGVTCTIFACALALERNLAVTQAIIARGYDIVGHGYRWVPHHGMTEEEEREQVRRARDTIERLTGQRIVGWLTRPPITSATRRVLAEEGFLYDSDSFNDDLPYFVPVGGRQFLVVPHTLDQNDIRFWRSQLFTANDFFEYLRDAFDSYYEEGAFAPKLMTVSLHCRIVGRPARAQALDRFLAYVRRFPDVWIANRGAIARYWWERYGGSTTPQT